MAGKWFLFEEIENSHPLLSVDAKIRCVDAHQYGVKKGTVTQVVIKGEKDTDHLCFIREEYNATGKAFFNKILREPAWALGLSEKILQKAEELMALSDEVKNTSVSKLSNAELGELVERWALLRSEAHGFGMPWNYVELENNLFSSYLAKYIEQKISENKLNLISNKVFAFFSIPLEKTFAKKEEENLLTLAIAAKKDKKIEYLLLHSQIPKVLEELPKVSAKFAADFERHFEDYCWMSYVYLGPAWSREYFMNNLISLVKRPLSELQEELLEKQKFYEKTKREQQALMLQLGFDETHRKHVEIAQSIIYSKAMRKDSIYHGFYCMENAFREAAKRLGLSPKQFRMLMSWELKKVISSGKCDSEELNKRYAFRVFHYDGKTKTILSGEAAKKFYASLDFEKLDLSKSHQLTGECACSGKGEGAVKIINVAAEMEKMQQGDVLVSRATTPDIVPAMKKASAIITDMGGITCHAAIVSRELNIPCIIGTKVATKIFKDGDRVSVDATNGVVQKL